MILFTGIVQALFDIFVVLTVLFIIMWQRAINRRLDYIDEKLEFLNSARSRVIVIGKNGKS